MLLIECAEELGRHYDIRVFGTDLDARGDRRGPGRASIRASIAPDVGPERLDKFFSTVDSSYRVKDSVRERLVFAVHDLVMDPPYSRMDIVSVRNLLIYFDSQLQKQVLPLLHYALHEGGLLFLGTAETIGEAADLFATLDKKWRIYRCINRDKATHMYLPGQPGRYEAASSTRPDAREALPKGSAGIPLPVQRLLLEALPPSVLVDRQVPGDLHPRRHRQVPATARRQAGHESSANGPRGPAQHAGHLAPRSPPASRRTGLREDVRLQHDGIAAVREGDRAPPPPTRTGT